MNIQNISNPNNLNHLQNMINSTNQPLSLNKQDKGNGFAEIMEKTIDALNAEQLVSEEHKRTIATGEVKDLQKAIIEIDRAGLSLSLAGEVKNKVLAAYKEIMNIQV